MKTQDYTNKEVTRRQFLSALGVGAAGIVINNSFLSSLEASATNSTQKKPNFVVLFADDMGYGDWNRGGHPTIITPNMEKMAEEGIHLTQFYSGNPVCSPSRSALLTGRNCCRTGVLHVFRPNSAVGMSLNEITIADALKPLGYKSACFGKWHLGDAPEYNPIRQGFDYYYGILYSNDMNPADIYRNFELVEHPAEQATLTKRYTEQAIRFMEENKDNPFFVYVPYAMPHTPIYASDDFLGTSARGLYGDVVQELDWSVGQINQALERLGLAENTLVIFTSDNGPWVTQRLRGGHPGQLSGAKGDTWEGGMREPFIAKWPGRIPSGTVSTQVGSVIDFLPTFVELAGGKVPDDRPIDGINIIDALEGKEMPDRTIIYYKSQYLRAVRRGKWKLHFAYYDSTLGGYDSQQAWIVPETPLLYDLHEDPSERFNVAAQNPDIVAELVEIGEKYKEELIRNGENRDLINHFTRGGGLV